MHARHWLALGVGALGGLLLWVALAGDKPARASASGPERSAQPVGDASSLELAVGPAVLPSVAPTRADARAPEPDSGARQALEATSSPVVVRVRLALASGEPASFAGWRVEAQSWIEKTNETFPHETEASAGGVAEFRFPGFVHVDWLRCVPPPESGLALAFAEHHANLDPGETLEETLELEPGGVLATRVLALDGQPVAGARVHAFSDDYGWTTDWQPGLAWATSGADGRLELPPLPPGKWSLAVEPAAWVQIEPAPGDERGLHTVEAGQRLECEDLRVVPRHALQLHLLDAAGRGVPEAEVSFRPLDLGAAGLRSRLPEPLEIFLGRALAPEAEGAPRIWPHDEMVRTTDENGDAALFGIAGTWELSIVQNLVRSGPSARLSRVLELPSPDLTLRLPAALARFSSRVVDDRGPVEGAKVLLRSLEDGGARAVETRSARDGTFELRGVPPGVPCSLGIWEVDHLPAQWTIAIASDQEAPDRVLRRGVWMNLLFVDTSGAALPGRTITTLSLHPEEPQPAEELAVGARPRSGSTNRLGRVRLGPFPPGTVELGLLLPTVTGVDALGNSQLTQSVHQRWTIPVRTDEQSLVVDLSRYAPPAPPTLVPHRGLVVDALTGAPLAGAQVSLSFASGSRWTRTDEEGRFSLLLVSRPCSVSVHREGYLSLELPEQEWPAGGDAPRLALQPGGHDLVLELVDREGVRLPRASVFVKTEDGRGLATWIRQGDEAQFTLGWFETDGRVVLTSVPPGRLRLELEVDGQPLGSATLESDAGRAPQQETVRLERSLAEMRAAIEHALEEEGEEVFGNPYVYDVFEDE